MALVRKYKLRGFSAWRLGHEDPAAWQQVFSVPVKRLR
jgi:spore germination protein YaaH